MNERISAAEFREGAVKSAVVYLPWPDKRLNPNARVHWATLARVKKAAKHTAYYSALQAGMGKIDAESVMVSYSFFPPDRRPRDIDNLIASMKAANDGLASAIGVDDSAWTIRIEPRGAVEKNGMVKVEIEWQSQA